MEATSSRAVVIKSFGGYDVLNVQDFELPPLNNNVEIKVEFGGLNFADLYIRQGLMQDKKFPFVLGMECSGIITAIGSETSNLKVGQRVICYDYKCGMHREILRVPEDKCYPIPDFVSLEDAAALFVNYLTAYFALFELGNLRKDENLLLLSCAGGVGCAATQLAKTVDGVKIYGTTSPEKANQVEVDFVTQIDGNFKTNIKTACWEGFDLIISNQSGEVFQFLQTLLKPLGRIVVLGANNMIQNEKKLSPLTLIRAWLGTKNISLRSLVMDNRVVGGLHLGTLIDNDSKKVRDVLDTIFDLLKQKKIKPKIFGIYALDEIVEATKLLGERKNVGKVLLSMKKSDN